MPKGLIRCVVFDFDGTLVLSNEIKREGFLVIAAELPGGLEVMERLLVDPPGDRFAILSAFARHYDVDGRALASRYSAWCEERIVTCPERAGADRLLGALKWNHVAIYVVSATPEAPLRAIVERRYPQGTFDGVLGGYGAKHNNIQAVLSVVELAPEEVLVVGDGIDDYQAARHVGCRFEGIAGGTLSESAFQLPLHTDLMVLWEHVSEEIALS